jgi:LysM repeat protein
MRRRSPARWLAPLALIACAFAIYAVVDQELLKDDGGAKTSETSPRDGTTSTATTKRKSSKKAKTYTVKNGDTFSGIADKEGVEVEALQEANPKVDASALHPGQKLKLPR